MILAIWESTDIGSCDVKVHLAWSRTQTLHTCTREGLVTQVQILGPASEFEASNEIAKRRLLE